MTHIATLIRTSCNRGFNHLQFVYMCGQKVSLNAILLLLNRHKETLKYCCGSVVAAQVLNVKVNVSFDFNRSYFAYVLRCIRIMYNRLPSQFDLRV